MELCLGYRGNCYNWVPDCAGGSDLCLHQLPLSFSDFCTINHGAATFSASGVCVFVQPAVALVTLKEQFEKYDQKVKNKRGGSC